MRITLFDMPFKSDSRVFPPKMNLYKYNNVALPFVGSETQSICVAGVPAAPGGCVGMTHRPRGPNLLLRSYVTL